MNDANTSPGRARTPLRADSDSTTPPGSAPTPLRADAQLVMTLIGEDRPGLVEQLASLVVTHGGNWLESRMSHLGGHFAGILRISIPANEQTGLVTALENLGAHGL